MITEEYYNIMKALYKFNLDNSTPFSCVSCNNELASDNWKLCEGCRDKVLTIEDYMFYYNIFDKKPENFKEYKKLLILEKLNDCKMSTL